MLRETDDLEYIFAIQYV